MRSRFKFIHLNKHSDSGPQNNIKSFPTLFHLMPRMGRITLHLRLRSPLIIDALCFWAPMKSEKQACGFDTYFMIKRERTFLWNRRQIEMGIFLRNLSQTATPITKYKHGTF